jgi:hypothetical protein
LFGDSGDDGFDDEGADEGFFPEDFAVDFFASEGDVVFGHEAGFEGAVSGFDAVEPFDPGDAEVAWDDQAQREAVAGGEGLVVHLVAEENVFAGGVGDGEGAGEVLFVVAASDFFLAAVVAPEGDFDGVLGDVGLFEQGGEGSAGPFDVGDGASEAGGGAVAAAFEGGDQFLAGQLFELVEGVGGGLGD